MKNLYVRIFTGAGVPFGLFVGVFTSLLVGPRLGLLYGLSLGLFFGITMAAILGVAHQRQVRRIGATEEVLQVMHFEMPMSSPEAFEKCTAAAEQIGGNIVQKDAALGRIVLHTKASWKSWGEHIAFELKPQGSSTFVKVSSRPRWKTTVVDYGKNFQNLDRVRRALALHSS